MSDRWVGVLGASSLVGAYLLPQLATAGWQVQAFSRQAERMGAIKAEGITWHSPAGKSNADNPVMTCADWISLAPIWVLSQYFSWMAACGARRVVAVSSTSRWVKTASSDPAERLLAERLAGGEQELTDWASQNKIEWIILRPTLIYGDGRDRNISSIARFIQRFGFFPLLGEGRGLRQPIHAREVAIACRQVLTAQHIANRAYEISGGETLSYRNMVCRVFEALGRHPRIVSVPLWCFRLAAAGAQLLPPFRNLSTAMAERMNQDLVFDHSAASQDWGFTPGPFRPNFDVYRDPFDKP